jgi:hypothetical protein
VGQTVQILVFGLHHHFLLFGQLVGALLFGSAMAIRVVLVLVVLVLLLLLVQVLLEHLGKVLLAVQVQREMVVVEVGVLVVWVKMLWLPLVELVVMVA